MRMGVERPMSAALDLPDVKTREKMGLGISLQVSPSEIYKVTGQWEADPKRSSYLPSTPPSSPPPGLILSAGFSQAA